MSEAILASIKEALAPLFELKNTIHDEPSDDCCGPAVAQDEAESFVHALLTGNTHSWLSIKGHDLQALSPLNILAMVHEACAVVVPLCGVVPAAPAKPEAPAAE